MRFPPLLANTPCPPASVPRSSRAALPVPERFASEGDEEEEATGDESTGTEGGREDAAGR